MEFGGDSLQRKRQRKRIGKKLTAVRLLFFNS
jgi:hypothetical protein